MTDFSVDFSAHTSSTSDSFTHHIDAVKLRVTPDRPTTITTVSSAASGGGSVTLPARPNPLKPPSEAEILFVLPSVSMRLTTDQRQSMAHPRASELLAFARNLQQEKANAAAEVTKKSTATTPSDNNAVEDGEREGQNRTSREKMESDREVEHLTAKVHLSFQTDLHGVIQLGLLDVPWLPLLIKSYINEQMHDTESEFYLNKY